jgi:hypothetical protein
VIRKVVKHPVNIEETHMSLPSLQDKDAWSISFVRDPSPSGHSNLFFLFIMFVFALRQYVQNVPKWSQWKKKQPFFFLFLLNLDTNHWVVSKKESAPSLFKW